MLIGREDDNIESQIAIAEKTLNTSFDYYSVVVKKWAVWDYAYEYMKGNFDEFEQYNLNEYPFQTYHLDFITLIDTQGNIIYERFYQVDQTLTDIAPIDLKEIYWHLNLLTLDSAKSHDLENTLGNSGAGVSGFLNVDHKLLYMSTYPILPENTDSPPVGTMIFGRFISDPELLSLQQNAQTNFLLEPFVSSDFTPEQQAFLKTGKVLLTDDAEKVYAHQLITDIFDENTLILSTTESRELYYEGIRFITITLSLVALCCLAILFAVIKFIGFIFVKPFASLVKEVDKIDFDSLDVLPLTTHDNPEFLVLEKSINNMLIRIKTDRDSISEQNQLLYYNANFDSLTGLRNWHNINEVLTEEIEHAKGNNTLIGIYFIDLDRFNYITNTMGHETSNTFIVATAERIKEALPEDSYIGRMGDDKFIVISCGFHEVSTIHSFANKINTLFETYLYANDIEITMTVSVGSCTYPQDGDHANVLLKNAEIAMHRARQLGGNMHCPYKIELTEALQRKVYIENQIRNSIQSGFKDFHAFFQPKALSATGEVLSCEALIRWSTHEGLVSPGEFVPLAEETGLIVPLSWWMLKEACLCNKEFEKHGIINTVSVNIPAQVLLHKDFMNKVKETLEECSMDAKQLDIEITEETLIDDMESTNEVLEFLHNLGVSISIDDFGTGYSSLSYIKKLAVDRIKIDRSFIIGLNNNEEDRSIVNAIVAMAKSLHMVVTAEGVEDAHQYKYLQGIGCEEIQGFFISRPIPMDEYIKFCKQWHLEL